MKLKTILIILGGLVLLIFLFRTCTSYVKNEISYSISEITGSKSEFNFAEIDFTTGEYALIIDDKRPAMLVDDASVLEANKDKIETDISWMNYLPGEGGGHSGLRLFKNGAIIETRLARKFKTFKVGNLREYGKPMEFKSIYQPRELYLKQKDSLAKSKDVFISRATEVSPDGYEYRFTLFCPSILVAQQDSTFNEYEFGEAFAQRIKTGLSQFSGFRAGDNAMNSTEPEPLLVMKKEGSTYYLRNDETKETLPLKKYALYGAQLTFFCTEAFYQQVQEYNFNPTFVRAGLSETEIKALIREKIGFDNAEVTLEGVFEFMFHTDFRIGKLQEQKYELRYFELSPSKAEQIR